MQWLSGFLESVLMGINELVDKWMVFKYKTLKELKCLVWVDTVYNLAGYHDVIVPVRFSEDASIIFEGHFTYNRHPL